MTALDALIASACAGNFIEGLCSADCSAERSIPGELLFKTSGVAVILKQVLLDDDMFIIGVLQEESDGSCMMLHHCLSHISSGSGGP